TSVGTKWPDTGSIDAEIEIGRATCRERGFMLRGLIMFKNYISRHNSNFFSDKLVLTSVTPASSAPVLHTPKATSSTLYFDSLTVNAGNGCFLYFFFFFKQKTAYEIFT